MANKYNPVTVFDADERGPASGGPDTELAFQDFSGASIPADSSSRSTTPRPHNGDNLYAPDLSLRSQIGSGGPGSKSWLSLDGWATHFDVETKMVLERCWKTMWPREEYLEGVLGGQPDLYGPFWLPTTLIFVLFFSSSLSGALSAYLASLPYTYDFFSLSLAVALVYLYALAFPAALWAVMTYWAGVEGRSVVELVNLYGYGLTVFVPVALLSIPPIFILRFVASVVAFLLSLTFLIRNLYPIFASSPSKAARALVLAVAFFHFVFVLILWFAYLGVGGPVDVVGKGGTGQDAPAGGAPAEDVGDVPAPGLRWAF